MSRTDDYQPEPRETPAADAYDRLREIYSNPQRRADYELGLAMGQAVALPTNKLAITQVHRAEDAVDHARGSTTHRAHAEPEQLPTRSAASIEAYAAIRSHAFGRLTDDYKNAAQRYSEERNGQSAEQLQKASEAVLNYSKAPSGPPPTQAARRGAPAPQVVAVRGLNGTWTPGSRR